MEGKTGTIHEQTIVTARCDLQALHPVSGITSLKRKAAISCRRKCRLKSPLPCRGSLFGFKGRQDS